MPPLRKPILDESRLLEGAFCGQRFASGFEHEVEGRLEVVQVLLGRGGCLSNIGKQQVVSRERGLPERVLLRREEPGVRLVLEAVEAVREGRERLGQGDFVLGAIVVSVLCVSE